MDPLPSYNYEWDMGYFTLPENLKEEYVLGKNPKLPKQSLGKVIAYLDFINGVASSFKAQDDICRELGTRIIQEIEAASPPFELCSGMSELDEVRQMVTEQSSREEVYSKLLPYSIMPESAKIAMIEQKLPFLQSKAQLVRRIVGYIDFISVN